MLSIGKLATGQANYYLEQADGRVDRASSVASGVEDYYLDGGEPAGDWLGSGINSLGLRGRVEGEPLHRVLAGQHPVSGEPLRDSTRARVPGRASGYELRSALRAFAALAAAYPTATALQAARVVHFSTGASGPHFDRP